uniref:Uncharacterized protein n=1 Tax=Canis lupus familiaris TaxID=9615 RepID=A0A8I3SC01_CANLF
MSRAPRPLLPGARAAGPPTYEMLKEEHEVVVLGSGAPQSAAPATTTVINICGDTVVPDHVVWSLFNTVFMNWCCLGFMALLLLREGGWGWEGESRGAGQGWGRLYLQGEAAAALRPGSHGFPY